MTVTPPSLAAMMMKEEMTMIIMNDNDGNA